MLACIALRSFMIPGRLVTYVWLVMNGLFGYGNQVTMTAAMQRAKAAPAIAMSYLSVIW